MTHNAGRRPTAITTASTNLVLAIEPLTLGGAPSAGQAPSLQ